MVIKNADTFLKRLIGLSNKKHVNYGMLFKKCNKIHTFMMRFDLDLYILDENNKIIDVKKNIKKNKIVIINLPRKKTSILEISSTTSFNQNIGEVLLINNS